METVTLIKDYQKRQFSPKAAKIAIEHYGWSELTSLPKPNEVGTKTRPPVIDGPVKLKPVDYPIQKKVEVNDDLGMSRDSVTIKADEIIPAEAVATEVKATEVKKTRKKPIKSKTK